MQDVVTLLFIILIFAFVIKMIPAKGVKAIMPKDLKAVLDEEKKGVFIDVRTENEYKLQHIPQFVNMPVGSDFSTLPKDEPIYVICQSGLRSNKVCKQLVKMGYSDVTNIRRGMSGLRAQ